MSRYPLRCLVCPHPFGAHAQDPRNGCVWCRVCNPKPPSAVPPSRFHTLSTAL